MSRYKCPPCEREWSTDNMAPVCGDCYYRQRQELEALAKEQDFWATQTKHELAIQRLYRDALEKIMAYPCNQATSLNMARIAEDALPQSPGEEGKRG